MNPSEKPESIAVVGIGVGAGDLSRRQRAVIQQADLLVGGRRHLSFFQDMDVCTLEIDRNLSALVEKIRTRMGRQSIVVLASGDPLFFGIGAFLVSRLGRRHVRLYPNVTAAAAAFGRIREPWSRAGVVSLHGRRGHLELLTALREKKLVAVYTDRKNNPARVARLLLDSGVRDVSMCVCENMGLDSEKIRWTDLDQAADGKFSDLNVVILKHRDEKARLPVPSMGLPEDFFDHQEGLITKREIRAVSLARLDLQEGQILWDLGAGSGSVGLEASILLRNGAVWAVEKDLRRVADIEANREKLRAFNVTVVRAELPRGLETLPDPDRVFIGGGGRQLPAIIAAVAGRLTDGGVMVINTILLQSLQSAMAILKEKDFTTDLIQLQVNRQRSMAGGIRLAAENPVFILTAYGQEKA